VQFGGSIFDKPHARIAEVALEEFQRCGRAQVVDHSRLKWLGLWPLPPAYAAERIVARARCLARTQPAGVYNLVGRNCETVALWCVCGMGESLQRQWVPSRVYALRSELDALRRGARPASSRHSAVDLDDHRHSRGVFGHVLLEQLALLPRRPNL
jgi:hypothetical protein